MKRWWVLLLCDGIGHGLVALSVHPRELAHRTALLAVGMWVVIACRWLREAPRG